MRGMSPPTNFAEKVEKSFWTSSEVHSGQATSVAPLDETSSSKRWSQSRQAYSKIGMQTCYPADGALAGKLSPSDSILREGYHEHPARLLRARPGQGRARSQRPPRR